MKKISQQKARALQKRVDELERLQIKQRNAWVEDYPGGVNLGAVNLEPSGWLQGRLEAARMLGHVIVATTRKSGALHFYALK